ncbi:uncharacterized protein NECHADRAFT_89330 [Fusarium vanettenii 77-13-4]|uniref:Zn(2)-C6 fungal-type domain-containing protein n=1 Tax=Fusarium vanettenii (strain ATCC MYA-4622 / CBS 123669 / FGSC 9596 / NRRL 45880 / 77-13-4) TaxID=660122 RepID=C7ZQV9_FUSV7|nr:uncharacterized protein NECHADRAFT_89330 [Fusarium vanettenii 77-13-4]EEU33597.1 hypothetical protein NECHADRAFT_89330 [Fusarium vanettenii 77-13-4]
MISSRRKSCSACARGKRRCDLGFPQCGRCLARRVTCVYAWISPQEAQEVVKTTNPSLWTPQESPHHYLDQSGTTEAYQSSHDLPGPGERHANNDTTFCPAPMTLSPALVSLIDEITGRGRTISFLAPGPQLQFLDKSYPNAGSDVHAPQPPQSIGIPPTPFQGASGSSMYTDKIFQARAEYAASRLVRQVRTLAETGQTSFIHHSHIDGSAILRDAFAACCLNMTRNSANESLIRSEIARRAELLIEATETAISLTPPSSHSAMNLDLLPAVQAMLIYQCMRLFSTGDIAQQTQAELDAKSLARWVDILQEQTQWSWDNFSSGTQLDLSVWKDWVQAESIRRTMIFAELLDGIYTFLRFGWYQPSARMAKLGFTGQVAIWEARSPAEWHQARGQKPWVELNISSFHDGIKAAFPDDLDELGIIILSNCVTLHTL